VAHFQDCLDELRSLVTVAGFDEGRVVATSLQVLTDRRRDLSSNLSGRTLMVVGERHPLQSHDEALLEFARSLSCQCRLAQHVSLEDPLLKMFAGRWVQGVLRGVGMKDDEAIKSRTVRLRIRSAQRMIAKRATGDAPAGSAEEWLKKNCPTI
jgi:hypothetical protein